MVLSVKAACRDFGGGVLWQLNAG